MRISDWSSDVCSSDLLELRAPDHREKAQPVGSGGRPYFPVDLHIGEVVREGLLDRGVDGGKDQLELGRSEEHTSELQSLMRISYAVFCLKKKKQTNQPLHR